MTDARLNTQRLPAANTDIQDGIPALQDSSGGSYQLPVKGSNPKACLANEAIPVLFNSPGLYYFIVFVKRFETLAYIEKILVYSTIYYYNKKLFGIPEYDQV